jgi:hypothetical protein
MTGEPPGVSLRALKLVTSGNLNCPLGGHHHIQESDLQAALRNALDDTGAQVHCLKCQQVIELHSALQL